MGRYTTRATTSAQYHAIVNAIANGYTYKGTKHRPNKQIATILTLESNLGCRIGDVLALNKDSIVSDGEIYHLNIKEQKTGKIRRFIVPPRLASFIASYANKNAVDGKLFTVSAPAVWKALREATQYLGLGNISTHSFRKMCACNLYEASGHDIETVCTFLQHSSINTTRAYIARSSAQMETAINKILDF